MFGSWLYLCNLWNFIAVSLLNKGVPRSPMVLLHRGTSEPRGPNGASAPGDPPVISPVVLCFCTSHRRVTFISYWFGNELTVFRFNLSDVFEFCSKVCFAIVSVSIIYSVMFVF